MTNIEGVVKVLDSYHITNELCEEKQHIESTIYLPDFREKSRVLVYAFINGPTIDKAFESH